MGVINAENTLSFRSSSELFNKIKKRLSPFDAQNMIDEGDFYDYVVEILELLGVAVYSECEAVVHVREFKAALPCNFKLWYAAYKVHPEVGFVPSINEQKPWIWYQHNEVSQICPAYSGNCRIGCDDPNGKSITKIVVRTFVNGDSYNDYPFRDPLPLFLSPNVKDRCSPHAKKVIRTSWNEVTIDHNRTMHFRFKEDEVYMQYYGLPFDENFLPMIPDNTMVESAIEYYIYTKLFETFYLTSSVPNIANQLKYVKEEFERKYMPQALYWVKLPSFARTVQSIKLMRSKGKWAEWMYDRTRAGETPIRGYTGFPIV